MVFDIRRCTTVEKIPAIQFPTPDVSVNFPNSSSNDKAAGLMHVMLTAPLRTNCAFVPSLDSSDETSELLSSWPSSSLSQSDGAKLALIDCFS